MLQKDATSSSGGTGGRDNHSNIGDFNSRPRAGQEQTARTPIYLLRLRPGPGIDPVHALRAALKSLLRRYGLRCVSAREERQ
jgi:hypothetical protein